MGGGSWKSSDYVSYARSASFTSDGRAKATAEVFTSKNMKREYDPRFIQKRESCDSDDHPLSRAVIFGVDVTGSMGMIAHHIIKEGLGILMSGIHDRQIIPDAHLMFMGIGDVKTDTAPLQVSQFEADLRIAQQLQDLYIEGRGGNNNTESYDLPWYFAANYTDIDCWNKRQQKGLLFTMGDEMPPAGLTPRDLEKVFGTRPEGQGFAPDDLLKQASEKYEVFHLIVAEGSYCRGGGWSRVYRSWYELMGNRAIILHDHTELSEIVLAVIKVLNGVDPEDAINEFQGNKENVRIALHGPGGRQ